MNFLRSLIVCGLIGVLTSMAGYKVFDFNTHQFSLKNMMILLFACGIAQLMMLNNLKELD